MNNSAYSVSTPEVRRSPQRNPQRFTSSPRTSPRTPTSRSRNSDRNRSMHMSSAQVQPTVRRASLPACGGPVAWSPTLVFIAELLVTLFICLIAFLVDDVLNLHGAPIPFIERDPSLSYEAVTETVPTRTLVVVSTIVPGLVVLLGTGVQILRDWSKPGSTRTHLIHGFFLVLALAQALLTNKAITDCTKIAVGKQRPNFFALCDYAGYAKAIDSGNFSSYLAATTPGAFGDIAKCQASSTPTWKAQRSFPSGHASSSFAGMMFVVLYWRGAVGVHSSVFFNVLPLLGAAPLVLSSYVAISRVRDRYHDTTDISIGAIIGIVCAMWAWGHYTAMQRSNFRITTSEGRKLQPDFAGADEDETARLTVTGSGIGASASAASLPSPSAAVISMQAINGGPAHAAVVVRGGVGGHAAM